MKNHKNTVVITGATGGLGMALVAEFLGAGYRVIGSRRGKQRVAPSAQWIIVDGIDLSDSSGIELFVEEIGNLCSSVDIVINNAAINASASPSPKPVAEFGRLDQVNLAYMFKINCLAPLLVAQGLVPLLKKGTRPAVVNISTDKSQLGRREPGNYGYRASKIGLNMFSEILNYDLDQFGIDVFCLHPGSIAAGMGESHGDVAPTIAARWIREIVQSGESNAGELILCPLDSSGVQ